MDTQQFGTFVAEQRKAKGYTQKELAEKLGVTDKTISRWENGHGYPDIVLLEPLAKELEISGAAVLFMLVHLHAFTVKEVLANLPHLATGLVYGLALLLSRNATLPVLLHMMNNLPAMVLGTL